VESRGIETHRLFFMYRRSKLRRGKPTYNRDDSRNLGTEGRVGSGESVNTGLGSRYELIVVVVTAVIVVVVVVVVVGR